VIGLNSQKKCLSDEPVTIAGKDGEDAPQSK
jgi:hypothetical protein